MCILNPETSREDIFGTIARLNQLATAQLSAMTSAASVAAC